ncbi:hypothetical protein DRJ25_00110 [Candidatus Woesearchaeota archaeon]|nr:MAG: hypothetical protein DRJ25_00110 [Candidatus Woesearchaeota archaeon]
MDKIISNISLGNIKKSLPSDYQIIKVKPSLLEIILSPSPDESNKAKKFAKVYKRFNSLTSFASEVSERFLEEDWENAFMRLRDFLSKIDGKKLKMSSLFKWTTSLLIKDGELSLEANRRFMGRYFSLALSELFMSRPERSLWFTTLASEFATKVDHPAKLEVCVADAFFSEALRSSLSEMKWKNLLELTEDFPEWERMGETKNVVKVLPRSEFLKKSLVFKESRNLDDLVAEAETAKFFSENLNLVTPTPLFVSKERYAGENFVYVMSYLSGESLLNYLKEGNKSYIREILNILSRVHTSFPIERSRLGKLDIALALEKKMDNCYAKLNQVKESLKKGYAFLIDLFEQNDGLWRYNKDAHPENWLISDKQIMLIDTENNYLVPVVFDLANLLGYGDFFSVEEMSEEVLFYYKEFKTIEPDLNIGESDFELLFWNAVIH